MCVWWCVGVGVGVCECAACVCDEFIGERESVRVNECVCVYDVTE